jgi:hypothetical protein
VPEAVGLEPRKGMGHAQILLIVKKTSTPIDLVMTVGKCSFIDAVELLKDNIDR